MRKSQYVLVTEAVSEEDAESFGPFTSRDLAEKFRDEHEDLGVRGCYSLMVVELQPVSELRAQIHQERTSMESMGSPYR